MKKVIFLICTCIFFFPTAQVFSSTSYTTSSGIRECQLQARSDNSGKKWIPTSNNTSAPSTGTVACVENGYYSGSWGPWIAKGNHYSCPSSGYASSIQESGNNYRVYCKVLDNTSPTVGDISSSLTDNGYHKANISNITLTGNSAGGSPISLIESEFEQASNESSFVSRSASSSVSSFIEDFSQVDVNNRNDVTPNNYRPYTHRVTQICDEAGNCVNDIKTFVYNIYANNVDAGISQTTGDTQLTDGSAVANGQQNTITLSLRDAYGNKVIPVYESDNITKIREVTLDFDYDNDLYLDQYTQSGEAGVSFQGPGDVSHTAASIQSNGNKANTISDRTQISGDYDIHFKVYTPTDVSNDKAYGGFLINSLNASVSDVVGEVLLSSFLNFRFQPLYEAIISGDIKENGLISGTQTGSIVVTQNDGGVSTSSRNLFLEFGSGTTNVLSPGLNLQQLSNTPYSFLGEGNGNKSLFQSNFSSTTYPLTTSLTLSGGLLTDIENSYLSTHIEYILDSKNIRYNSDIIGKDHYWGSFTGGTVIQKGVKVLGKTHSQKQEDILASQNTDDIHILGNIEKSDLKKDIRKSTFSMVKQVSSNNGTLRVSDLDGDGLDTSIWDNTDGVSLQGGKILYFGDLSGSNVSIDVGPTHTMKGSKTLVVIGGNIYIESNIVNDTDSDILGIIVLKDENDNGGNIYINPEVTRVDGIMYADKSLLSYDGSSELDFNTPSSITANQLYIYGTVFSENTIGGSTKTPPDCPYYATCIDSSFAQKYDLNFLRSYRMKSDGNTLNGGVNYFNIYDPSYEYYTFPIVIKYNSRVQTSPPPLFEK